MREVGAVVVLNYHRVSTSSKGDPQDWLHTVQWDTFDAQLEIAERLGQFVSLEDVCDATGLERLSFALTFDDVPAVSGHAVEHLIERGVPLTLSVCGNLAEDGQGWRDKIYALCSSGDFREIRDRTADWSSGAVVLETMADFYQFSKAPGTVTGDLLAELIDPLFAKLVAAGRHDEKRRYLGWEQLRAYASRAGVEVANHGLTHHQYHGLGVEARAADIAAGQHMIETNLSVTPRFFTVPFGAISQDLLVDITTATMAAGYRGALWTEQRANLIGPPYLPGRFVHLLRLEPPASVDGFRGALRNALRAAVLGPVALVERQRPRRRVQVATVGIRETCRAVEVLVRPEKDYAASERFLSYCYGENPYSVGKPAYAVAMHEKRPEAVAYALQMPFTANGMPFSGAYVAGWRALPVASALAAPASFRAVTSGDGVVGVYKPSADSLPAVKHWWQADVFAHRIRGDGRRRPAPTSGAWVLDEYEDGIADVASAMLAGKFSVRREEALYRWRVERYPLAEHQYVALGSDSAITAFAVLMFTRTEAHIVDYGARTAGASQEILGAAVDQAVSRGSEYVSLETSDPRTSSWVTATFACDVSTFTNYYRLDDDVIAALPDACADGRRLRPECVHETYITGDVLPR